MYNNNQTNQTKNQQNGSKHRARKATFAENPTSTDEDTTDTAKLSNPYSTHKPNNTNNSNTHKQKKQRQNNNTTTSKNNNNNNVKDKSKVTSYFASTPARVDERIKNSRASLLANSKG